MIENKLTRNKTHHQIWINNETYHDLETLRLRDESINSIVGFLIAFFKAHKDDIDIGG
jgi:hypothetical protein